MHPVTWQERYHQFLQGQGSMWRHAALIQVAAGRPVDQAAQVLRELSGGHHETLTGCWLELVRLGRQAGLSGEELARRLSFSQLPFAFYSPERLNSAAAESEHLAPDLGSVRFPPRLPDDLLGPLLAFQARELTYPDWTHECHLRVALAVYLLLGEPGCHVMGTGIQRLNAHFGIEQTPTGGYHETLTRCWYRLVGEQARALELLDHPERLRQALDYLADKELPLRYYRRETLRSWEARSGFIPPDLP